MKRVAIITRTKNRPELLHRGMIALTKQRFKDFIWVVVNDAGQKDPVDKIANEAVAYGIDVKVIHRPASTGIASAATNHGICESESEFIHIHDDDDTLEPDFLWALIDFLDKKPQYMGVVSCTNKVEETIEANTIRTVKKYEHYHLDSTIYIADLLWKNLFTTISFVYRRQVLQSVGYYDEKLPVLDDWDFNLRFALKHDIGVVPKFLANYHWRVGLTTGSHAQTVTAGSTLHQEYTAIIRNNMLRKDVASGEQGLGMLMTLARFHQLQADKQKIMDDKISAQLAIRQQAKSLLKKVGLRF